MAQQIAAVSVAASCPARAGTHSAWAARGAGPQRSPALRRARQPIGDDMKCAARVALGVAGGYFLGRTKKMKLALMLAGTAAGREAGGSAALLGQGKKIVDASPELSRLVDEVRGRLLNAGKGAALAVAARQVESLTDRVAGRVESSLSNLAERGRPSTISPQADQHVADEDVDDEDVDAVAEEDEAEEDEEQIAPMADEDGQQDEATPVATGAVTSGTRRPARRSP